MTTRLAAGAEVYVVNGGGSVDREAAERESGANRVSVPATDHQTRGPTLRLYQSLRIEMPRPHT